MYYNALFEQGLNIALRAYEVSLELDNDTLIGSAENLLGLLLMNVGRNADALDHFRNAVRLIPKYHGNGYLSFNYHATSNIAECFLKLNMPDSVIHYSILSLEEAETLGKERGLGITYWNLAEAHMQLRNLKKAQGFAHQGLDIVMDSPHRDVNQMLCASLMRTHELAGDRDSAYAFLSLGLLENNDPLNTDYSRVDFLNQAIDMSLRYRDVAKATELISTLKSLERELDSKEQGQRIDLLRDYYEKKQVLVKTQEELEVQERVIQLRTRVLVTMVALALLLLVVIYLSFRFFRQRQQIQSLEFQQQKEQDRREAELAAFGERMKALQTERNRIASDLHDDIGASLSSIRIYSDAATSKFEDRPEEVLRLMALIRETSVGLMDRMSDIIWTISSNHDSAEDLVLRMKSHGGKLFNSVGIRPVYLLNGDLSQFHPSVQARKNIYLIFKEAVNNMAKYGNAETALITISVENGTFRLSIKDDGIGFDLSEQKDGNGLKNMRQRATALNGQLTILSNKGHGTEVSLTCEIAKISDAFIHG